MDLLTLLMCASACAQAWAQGAPRPRPRRSTYEHYEPLVYAAIPLHSPVPILQVLSKGPLAYDRTRAPSVHYRDEFALPTHKEYEYAEYVDNVPQSYSDSYQHATRYDQQRISPSASSQDGLTILYARPNPHGGYTYRRSPSKSAPKRSPKPTTEAPVIIRVHRYRVVRDP